MKVGSLFSGIGGFDLGLERAGYEIAWQVEIDEYCRRVLKKHWPSVPCHADIRTIGWSAMPRVDLVCGGFPCQPFSCAGKRKGQDDDRYLWPEVVRCLHTIRPTWFFGENVPGLIHLGIEQVLSDLEALGYEATTFGIPAVAVDAHHIRKRLWILAYTASDLWRASGDEGSESLDWSRAYVADAKRNGLEKSRHSRIPRERRSANPITNDHRWPAEPKLGRVAHGVPNRVDRLRGLGNAIVPQIAEALGRMILESCP